MNYCIYRLFLVVQLVVIGMLANSCGGEFRATGLDANLPASTPLRIVQEVAELKEPIKQISFANADVGWGIGDGSIVHTTDGGTTWSIQQAATENKSDFENLSFSNEFTKVLAISATKVFAIGSGEFIRSEDVGLTWDRVEFRETVVRDFYFLNEDDGWLVANKRPNGQVEWVAALYYTKDGGKSWAEATVKQAVEYTTGTWWSVYVGLDHSIWLVGDNLLRSSDGGERWQEVRTCEGVYGIPSEIKFIDFAVGFMRTNQGNNFCVTSDEGVGTWQTRKFPEITGGVLA